MFTGFLFILGGILLFMIVALLVWLNLETFETGQADQDRDTTTSNTGAPPASKKKPAHHEIYATIKFKYRDYNDTVTERTVDVTTGKKGDTFKGFCHLRKEHRTFYFDRIEGFEIIDITTGEIVTPMTWRYTLQGTQVAKEAMNEEKIHIENDRLHQLSKTTWMRITDPAPTIVIKEKRFALGGNFNSGDIHTSKDKVENLGGIIQAAPNGKTDYIVINPDAGVNLTYERAIKKLIKRDIEPIIVTEDHWLSATNQSHPLDKS